MSRGRFSSSRSSTGRRGESIVESWRTDEPVQRRYFDVVLDGGERAVVYRDEEAGGWFSQRGV